MTNKTLEKQVKEDGAIMEEYLYRDGEVPPVIFFHFPKIDKKIANMMNKVPAGKLPVKKGFFLSLNDQVLMENRRDFLHHMGVICAAMELLKVLEAPESVVFCSEGWASTEDAINKGLRPSQDPKAKDVFIISGLSSTGDTIAEMKEKRMKMVKVRGKQAIVPELLPVSEEETKTASSPLLEAFFSSYRESIVKMRIDKSYKQFERMAESDPLDAFRQGVEAAITMTKLVAFERGR